MRIGIFTAYADRLERSRPELLEALKLAGHTVVIIGPEEDPLDASLRSESGREYQQVPIKRANTNPLTELLAIRDLVHVFRKVKIDRLLVYGARMQVSVLPAARLAGVKRLFSVINGAGGHYYLRGLRGKIVRLCSWPMMKVALTLATCVFFQNTDDRGLYLKQFLVKKRKTKIINGSGVNLQAFPKTPLPSDLKFLMLTRLASEKGIGEYAQAAQAVKEKYPSAEFHLVGNRDIAFANEEAEILDRAIESGTVLYHGATTEPAKWYQMCRIYVLPSYHEGTPRTVLEALSTGRAIITTDVPGCRDTIRDGKEGYLVPPQDVSALSNAMIKMIEDSEKTQEMSHCAWERAKEKYDVYKVNETLLTELIGENSNGL